MPKSPKTKKKLQLNDLIFPQFDDMLQAYDNARALGRDKRMEYKKLALEAHMVEVNGYKQLMDAAIAKNIALTDVINLITVPSYNLMFRHLVQATLLSLSLYPDDTDQAYACYHSTYEPYSITSYSKNALHFIKSHIEVAQDQNNTRRESALKRENERKNVSK